MNKNFVFEADVAAKKIYLSREFDAPIEKVWKAFTNPELLKKWAGPKDWTIQDQTWDFTVGGVSTYLMIGPESERHWMYDEFTAIENGSSFSSIGMFCDDEGNPNREGPKSYTENNFFAIEGNRTRIEATHVFDDENTFKWFAEGGFKEGTAMTYNRLDEVLASE